MKSIVVLTFCILYFVLAGMVLIPYAGFQHDEAVFAAPIFHGGMAFYAHQVGERWVPIMISSYAGAFKTWIWWPIFKLWHPSAFSLRFPALLIAALSIVIFWPIMVRAGGKRAAAVATLLLATDTMYLLTSVFDWGPCALQHIFLVAVMLAFIRFHETGKRVLLALACFLSGVALWEKALFFWLAGGLAVAALAIYTREVWKHVSVRNLLIAGFSFIIGAGPFVAYNVVKPNATLGENATFSSEQFNDKLVSAHRTFNASGIFGYICYDDWMQNPREPRNGWEAASLAIRENTAATQQNEMPWAYGLAFLLIPFTWRTRAWRPMLFALIFCLVGWALMLITKGAGASVHHVILLWPVTLMFLALPVAEASRRLPQGVGGPVLCMVVGFFALENFLATNQYLAQFIRNGPTVIWSNALYPMAADLKAAHYTEINGIDWGTNLPLEVLEAGQLPMGFVGVDENAPQPALEKMNQNGVVFLSHIKGQETFPEVDAKLDVIAAKKGLTKEVLKTYKDENGRPVFEVFQYH